ncbi:MAG TPA: nucleotidyltransferase family protein [Gammaproteobacteria bacterium]|nr:nucleotidyltransferase family protein [Gammaproteobacteria bacterium]
MRPACTVILLAAGQGTRFGANKLLQTLADGTPMAVACARTLQSVPAQCLAVVDDPQGAVAELLADAGLQIVANPHAHAGMGTSIACGVAASATAAGWIIALADMPYVPAGVVRQVADRLAQGADLVAPVWHGRRGHPVGFAARHGPALQALCDDRGARDILDAHRNSLELIETTDRGVIIDIDTPAALVR